MNAGPCTSPDLHKVQARFVLQRTGSRPLCFEGRLLACHIENSLSCLATLRLALYDCNSGYVVEVRCEPADDKAARRSWCAASLHDTLEAACGALEAVAPEMEMFDGGRGVTTVDALACAVARDLQERAQIQALRGAIGQFLFNLCSTAVMTSSGGFASHQACKAGDLTILSSTSEIVRPSQWGHARLLRRTS